MKKRIIILGAIVLVLVLAWTGGWFFLSHLVRQQIETLAFADGETAPQLTCGNLSITGYPFNLDINCTDATLVSGDVLLRVPAVRATALVYRPTHVVAAAIGPAEIEDAFTGHRSALAWDSMEASASLTDWRIGRVSVVGRMLNWTDLLFGAPIGDAGTLELHLLDMPELHDPDTGRASLAGFMRAEGLAMPGMALTDANAEIEAEITALPDDIRSWGAVPILPDWQQAGGELRLVAIRASDADAELEANGQLALDPVGHVTGTITIDSVGVAERIGPMIQEPWRTLVLGVPGENGRHANQLNFGNGAISSGLVPIGAIPPLF